MNVFERGIRRVDATQQRFTASAFVVGVVKKYGDDNAWPTRPWSRCSRCC